MMSISKSKLIGAAITCLMALLALCAVIQILTLRGTFTPMRPESEAGGAEIQLGTPGHKVSGRAYISGEPRPGAPLVVVLHGDAPNRKPSYQYVFATSVAAALPGIRVVALLRPGYADPFGARSDGDRGWFAAGENYTPAVIRDLTAALIELKSRYQAQGLILVGHSGGATLAADIAALTPGLVQHAILVSCPCDVPRFRKHMAEDHLSPVWLLPVHALSPMETINIMSTGTRITAISGIDDKIALPAYAEDYVAEARRREIDAELVLIAGKGHEILLEPQVLQAVAQAVTETAGGFGDSMIRSEGLSPVTDSANAR